MSLLDFLAVLSNSVVFILWAWGEILYFLFRKQPAPEVADWGAGVPVKMRRWYVMDNLLIRQEGSD